MKTEIWKCDHCSKEEEKQGDMRFIHLVINTRDRVIKYDLGGNTILTVLWCHTCIDSSKMNKGYWKALINEADKEIEKNKTPSFEERLAELLREVVTDEVSEQMSDQ